MPGLKDHVVVIGGTSGIGLSLAHATHTLGCKLSITGRGVARVAEIAEFIGPHVIGHHLDLEDTASIRAA